MARWIDLGALGFGLAALLGCSGASPAPAPLACTPLPGAESLWEQDAARLILVGVQSPPEAEAFLLTACAALQRGESLAALVSAGTEAQAVREALAAWTAQGAPVSLVALPAVDAEAPAAAQEALAQALAAAPAAADRAIALLDADSAARRPLGLSGETWAPAGARLGADQALALRAMSAPSPEPRLTLAPFEDVPTEGAARAYDGLITLPNPAPPESAAVAETDDLRGR